MIKNLLKLVGLLVLFAVILLVAFYWRDLRGIWPVLKKSPGNIVEVIENNNNPQPWQNVTDFPLKLPDNFKIEIFAKNLPGARVMAFGGDGSMWVTRTSAGAVTKLTIKDGKVVSQADVFNLTKLRGPHGIAFDPQNPQIFYLAEEHRISKIMLDTEISPQKIADLPTQGGGHSTRTIEFGPDDRLYVSIGSSCNVCDENDPRRAAIYVMDKDGKNFKQYAKGLRNSVFFDWSEVDGSMWATDMGRDLLGDDTPPDEINVIKEGGNYGWPICYGKNIHDTNFDKKTYIRNPCQEPFETPSKVDLQAHSAPLGLDFVPEEGWPEEYWYDLIVAFHGSWNRSTPTGYKLVRIKLDEKGNYQGTEDFITGWLASNGALGRPVDVLIQPGGVMYVSDDKAGVIYKISKIKE
jgi:glucose/arabinose dehydrogenase